MIKVNRKVLLFILACSVKLCFAACSSESLMFEAMSEKFCIDNDYSFSWSNGELLVTSAAIHENKKHKSEYFKVTVGTGSELSQLRKEFSEPKKCKSFNISEGALGATIYDNYITYFILIDDNVDYMRVTTDELSSIYKLLGMLDIANQNCVKKYLNNLTVNELK
ncbi:hypothetical protein [Pleionea mediterranea]|uniref:Lipoprotein n=1 Tax=Pleionea mediterranea TaxID=523701 RepID=A0A316G0K6_9GAMM|nr:hypothetical protein [Pleionea mediterranea]PWK54338.1 hypothetical protein C8D97_101186 [Pleionea mediterranea]